MAAVTPEAIAVLEYLRARPRGTTIEHLAFTCELGRRTVEASIRELRLGGHPIVSDTFGVRLARNADELAASNRSLRHRLAEQYRTLRSQRQRERRMRLEEATVRRETLWAEGDVA